MTLVAVHGGGGWYDASADYIVVDKPRDLDELRKVWRAWYHKIYLAELHAGEHPIYLDFSAWMIDRGYARRATSDDITVIQA